MNASHRIVRPLATLLFAIALPLQAQTPGKPTIEQFFSPASPLELVSARRADRLESLFEQVAA